MHKQMSWHLLGGGEQRMHAEEPCGPRTINCGPVFFFFKLKDVRVFIIIMKIIMMMMMIKKKKKTYCKCYTSTRT